MSNQAKKSPQTSKRQKNLKCHKTLVLYRITAMVSRCVLGCAPSYLRDLCCPVSVLAARRGLRSAARGEFSVPRARLAIIQ